MRPDFTLGETINREMAKDELWDAPTVRGHSEEVQTFIPNLQNWTLRLTEGKWFAEGCIAVMQLTGSSKLQVPGPPPGL